MRRLLKLLHLLGLSAFLGSILAFIVASQIAQGMPLQSLATLRAFVDAGTLALTLPGMWLVAVTGLAGAMMRGSLFSEGWLLIKQGLMLLIILNAHFIVVPAVFEVSRLAVEGASSGALPAGYASAYLRESLAGGANIALALGAAALGVWKPRRRQAAAQLTAQA